MAAGPQAAQLWALLDELAENDPRAYERLLRQQRARAARLLAPPRPHLCLRARCGGVAGRPVFINICSWERVPAPRSRCGPAPASAGRLEEGSAGGDLYSVIDVAYNPDVLQRGEENPEKMEHLIRLTLRFVEERCNLPLSHLYTREPFRLKGSLEAMQARLEGRQLPPPPSNQDTKQELTLEELLHCLGAEECSRAPVLLREEREPRAEVPLIQEVSRAGRAEQPRAPAHEVITVKDANQKPLRVELRIKLPQLSSVAECDLRVSKDDLIIEVPEKYKLHLDLPELVDEERTTATFHKGKGELLVSAPVPGADP
ncbi:PIH1 domain-containing protein 2 [Apus apus]|uniref:PIH1 domain-containing protein 2 n=1 Tax=Apus apus TaxID=8895 RepID=UPI0021F8A2AB|nr:PIH1 domain-containing protein 2 [Apus apus]